MTIQPQNALIFLLDRSGSMNKIKAATLEDYNGHLAKMKETAGLEYTLVTFDSIGTELIHVKIPIAEAPDLTNESFQPRGATPLIDAACITIDTAMGKYTKDDKVVITILTDGQENCSREYQMADLHDRIKTITGWGWQVVFLGASIDVYKDAGAAGVATASTMSYNVGDVKARRAAYGVAGQSIHDFYATGAPVNFSASDKAAAGDAFFAKQKPGEGGGGQRHGGEGGGAKVVTPAAAGGTSARKTLVDTPKL